MNNNSANETLEDTGGCETTGGLPMPESKSSSVFIKKGSHYGKHLQTG